MTEKELLSWFLKHQSLFEYKVKSKKDLPVYDALIVSRNRCPYPKKFYFKNPLFWSVDQVLEQDYLPINLIVVNDASSPPPEDFTDQTIEVLIEKSKKKKISLIYHKNKKQQKAALARNEGLKHVKNNLVYLLDDDCVIPKEVAKGVVSLFQEVRKINKKIVILNIPQNTRTSHPTSLAEEKKMVEIDFEKLRLTGTIVNTFPLEYLKAKPPLWSKNPNLLKPLILENYQGGNILADKNVLQKIGGFPDYKGAISYGEETGLAIKLLKEGYKIYYFPYLNLTGVHLAYGSSSGRKEFFGFDWLSKIKKPKLNLKEMIRESLKARVGSGCRISKELYFYVKIRNFAILLESYKKGLSKKWADESYKNFVVQNLISFQDKKGSIKKREIREKIWSEALEHAQTGQSFNQRDLQKVLKELR